MRLVGVDVPESDLFEKVKTEYMVHHTTAHPTDGYGEEHHKLTQVLERLEQGANPNTLDEKLRMAWNNFKTFKKLLALPTLDMYLPLSKFESIHSECL